MPEGFSQQEPDAPPVRDAAVRERAAFPEQGEPAAWQAWFPEQDALPEAAPLVLLVPVPVPPDALHWPEPRDGWLEAWSAPVLLDGSRPVHRDAVHCRAGQADSLVAHCQADPDELPAGPGVLHWQARWRDGHSEPPHGWRDESPQREPVWAATPPRNAACSQRA